MRTEPTTLEEGFEWYKEGRYMRKDMWGLAVKAIAEIRAENEALRRQIGDLMAALVRPQSQTTEMESAPINLAQSEKMKRYWAERKAREAAAKAAPEMKEASNG